MSDEISDIERTDSDSALDAPPGTAIDPPTGQQAEAPSQNGRGARKVRDGVVVSDKMDKTVVVLVERRVKHPRYHKTVTRSTRYKAHDEQNEAGTGDRVRIIETRPLSKDKYFRLEQVLERAK